jgi:hypothetical protein
MGDGGGAIRDEGAMGDEGEITFTFSDDIFFFAMRCSFFPCAGFI